LSQLFQFVIVPLLLLSVFMEQALAADSATAPRFAVPILCTENPAARTKVRGTAVVIDRSGTVLTAAHVVGNSPSSCVLTVIVPNDDWSRALGFRVFLVRDCRSDELLDIALCHITPLEDPRDWAHLRAAPVLLRSPRAGSPLVITGFTGWGFLPTVITGQLIAPRELYRRQDGCYCDFAVKVATHAGMSGSPVLTSDGQVVGLITTSGTGKFRGISFGTSLEHAAAFLRKAGLSPVNASNIKDREH
jgi:S1-C subfamily serine protease